MPLPQAGAKWFAEKFRGRLERPPADFGGILVLVPTRSAAKNLREAIFSECISRGFGGVCRLSVGTPDDEIAKFLDPEKTATAALVSAAWISALSRARLKTLTGLFPFDAPKREDFSSLARELEFLQNALAENLLGIASAEKILADSPDARRWENLAELEAAFESALEKSGARPRRELLKEAAAARAAAGEKFVVCMGNPDMPAALKLMLEKFSENGAEVSIAIFAREKSLFDEFGVPDAKKYCDLHLPISDEQISAPEDVRAEAKAAAALAAKYGADAGGCLAVSCEQSESVGIFLREFAKAGANAVSLEAQTLESSEIFNLLCALAEFCAERSLANFIDMARNPTMLAFLAAQANKSGAEILADLDFLAAETVCYDIAQARSALWARIGDLKESSFIRIKYLREIFDIADSCAALAPDAAQIAAFISGAAKFRPSEKSTLALSVLDETARQIASAEKLAGVKFSRDEIFKMLAAHLKSADAQTGSSAGGVALQDWMEIFWSPKPHVLACDMNEGVVPLANSDGSFLNDSVRRKLGMRDSRERRARDAYMLETLALSRQSGGMLTLCAPLKNLSSDPLKPSGILFQTADLPRRVKKLLGGSSDDRPAPEAPEKTPAAAPFEWRLAAPKLPYRGGFSITHINAYLCDPWEFYLQYVLKMNAVKASKDELDAMQFGSILHEVLRKFAESPDADSADAETIKKRLDAEFDALAIGLFGGNPRAQVRLQLEHIRNRLSSCAERQAEHRAKGWKIAHAEMQFEMPFAGETLKGVFDRIDIRESTGEVLVVDYKTYDKFSPADILEKHMPKIGGERKWLNVQLPIYRAAARAAFGCAEPQCAYFAATKSAADTGIYFWSDIAEYEQSALDAAKFAIEKIKQSDFTPAESPKYSSFEALFGKGKIEVEKRAEFEK